MDLPAEVFQLIERLRFEPRIKSLQTMAGRHRSPLSGGTPDFMEFRDYREGEPLQDIDWRASGKLGRQVVRRNEHEGLVKNWLLLDASASMDFPSESGKYAFMVKLAAALMLLLNGQGDPVGVVLAGGSGAANFNPSRTWAGLAAMIRHVAGATPGGAAGLDGALENLAGRLQKSSQVWIFTDFDRGPGVLPGLLGHIADRGHGLCVIHPFHPWERELPGSGEFRYADLEGRVGDLVLRPDSIAAEYKSAYDAHVDMIRTAVTGSGAAYHHMDITLPLVDHLAVALERG